MTFERHKSKIWNEDLTAYSQIAFSDLLISQQMCKKGVG